MRHPHSGTAGRTYRKLKKLKWGFYLRSCFQPEAFHNLLPSRACCFYSQELHWGRHSRPGAPLLEGERREGWVGRRHSRLIQWLVLFAVVHPGQHFPPQTFLLWSYQNGVRYKDAQRGTIHTAPLLVLPSAEPIRLCRLPPLSREGQALWDPADLILNPDCHSLLDTGEPHSLHLYNPEPTGSVMTVIMKMLKKQVQRGSVTCQG